MELLVDTCLTDPYRFGNPWSTTS